MQSMTLLRRMMAGEPILNMMRKNTHQIRLSDSDMDRYVKFDVQVAADLFWTSTSDAKMIAGTFDYGPMKLPFPDMWMEWVIPDDAMIGDERMDSSPDLDLVGMRCGAVLREPSDDGEGPGFEYLFFTGFEAGALHSAPIVVRVVTEDDGTFKNMFGIHNRAISQQEAQDAVDTADMFCRPIFMALGLINCRNVKYRETGSVKMGRSGTEKRRGVPAKELRYNTIILPGGGTQAGAKTTHSHRATAIHRVRGHFKTFTPEKPLLGKHVGTYWWGWSVRGNADNGEVQSDYTLGESRA